MDSTAMIKQIMDLNKKAFNDSFNAVIIVQEHAEKMVRVFWEKSTFFPEEGKKVIGDWIDIYKNGLAEFKANADGRFKQFEDYLLSAAGQVESSFDIFGRQTQPVTPTDDQAMEKAAAGIKKAVPRKALMKKQRTSRKKTEK